MTLEPITLEEIRNELIELGRPEAVWFPKTAFLRRQAEQKAWDASHPEALRRHCELVGMEHELNEAAKRQAEAAVLERWTKKQLESSGVGLRDIGAATSPSDTPALREAKAWWEEPTKPTWLVLVGTKGTGKTVAASWLVLQALYSRQTAKYVRAAELVRLSSFDEGRTQLEFLKRVDLLVVDDFGTEHRTDYGAGLLFDVFDSRHADRVRTVVTTNGSDRRSIEMSLGERLMDRVESDGWLRKVSGKSLRGAA